MSEGSILSQTFQDLEAWILEKKRPAFHAGQIFQWIYKKHHLNFHEMLNVPQDLRDHMEQEFSFPSWQVEKQQSSDGTIKYRIELEDGQIIESVWIPEEDRQTLCISSQVGCGLACKFCVTGLQGLKRNLSVEEIVGQVWYVRSVEKLPVSNIVFMGMGEPLQNLQQVTKAIDILHHDKAYGIGRRKISVSTAGLIGKFQTLLEQTRVNLAISLTGSTNESRDYWMPINQKYNLEALIGEVKQIAHRFPKSIMFEVVMIKDQTDTLEQAKSLANYLQGFPCKVNLIPYNENPHFPHLKRPSSRSIEQYRDVLQKKGIRTMLRRNRGNDISAACGQLSKENKSIS
ncbi:MAG: 23S rRNA (adenine(2503)-C(2))-methyltransferase RlmN [Bdellovibrionales bacterium]|nr:23S rRNA (adenine(2503)-C(2))-methyltransferase RlmN [Bdellovibrionales bacterium]